MLIQRFRKFILSENVLRRNFNNPVREKKTTQELIHPAEPSKTSFGIFRFIFTIASGLFIGAAISKNMANFLEENDLFVPSDDDDDDD